MYQVITIWITVKHWTTDYLETVNFVIFSKFKWFGRASMCIFNIAINFIIFATSMRAWGIHDPDCCLNLWITQFWIRQLMRIQFLSLHTANSVLMHLFRFSGRGHCPRAENSQKSDFLGRLLTSPRRIAIESSCWTTWRTHLRFEIFQCSVSYVRIIIFGRMKIWSVKKFFSIFKNLTVICQYQWKLFPPAKIFKLQFFGILHLKHPWL